MNASPLESLNPPHWARTVLYFVGAIGTLLRKWADDEGWLDRPTDDLITGLLALIMLMAVANASAQAVTTRRRRRNRPEREV